MKRYTILFPIFLSLLTGCPDKEATKNKELTEIEKLNQCIQDKKNNGLSISLCSKDLNKSSNIDSQQKRKSTLQKLNQEENTLRNSNKKIKNNYRRNPKTELEIIDECIANKKAKGLPSFECLQK